MNRMKSAAAKMKIHLGRDVRGLSFFDKVLSIANQQRKDLAATIEKLACSDRLLTKTRSDLEKSEVTIEANNQDIDRLRATCDQRDREIKKLQVEIQTLKDQVDELLPEDLPQLERTKKTGKMHAKCDFSLVEDLRPVVDLMNDVRRSMRRSPEPSEALRHSDNRLFQVFEITDIVKSLNASELIKLGGFVAVRALFNLPCGVMARSNVTSAYKGNTIDKDFSRTFVKWFGRCIEPEFTYVPPEGGLVYSKKPIRFSDLE